MTKEGSQDVVIVSSNRRTVEELDEVNQRCSCSKRLSSIFSMDDVRWPRIFQELSAEFLGSALLVIFGCGSAVTLEPELKPTVPSIAIAFGLTVATIIWCLGHVSGAQINPCVAIAMCLTRKMTLMKCLFYCIIQCVGAIAGAYILYAVTPPDRRGMLGITLVNDKITLWQGTVVEILATFVLVLAIFATVDSRIADRPGSKALAIGFVVTMDIPWAIQYTGASMNPGRSLGPVVAMGIWDHHWVFWVGPIVGAVAAGLLYENLFAGNASLRKTRACLCAAHFDENRLDGYELRAIRVDKGRQPDANDNVKQNGDGSIDVSSHL